MAANEHQLYVKGSKIWLPHAENVWQVVVLTNDYNKGDTTLKIKNDKKEELEIKIQDENHLPPLQNPSILIGQNDLTSLSYMHEPAVLHNLEVRFKNKQAIYTYCGIILVAINPYAELPLYGTDIIRAYRGHSMGELEPHIFAVAEEAYAKLERDRSSLSIIVSGESGAGKTVSAKYAMRYFAAVGGSDSETQIERKVLASSPIMEAFGNAKTTRNDNSSRFGKYTKLLFNNNMGVMNLTGAIMQTYLLEKSRVVFQSPDERNYHIFYQICSARDQMPDLMLDHFENFKYLNIGKIKNDKQDTDAKSFKETLKALKILDFSTQETNDTMRILAGILHLGNIQFKPKYKNNTEELDQDSCDISLDDVHLKVTSDIFKVNIQELRKWLITRQIESVNEYVLIPNNMSTAEMARDALAKHIYSKLFEYIVHVINKHLNIGGKKNSFIGVLDIYGFETFTTNSFEQFCINYANERLQQQFNQHVFKLEQEVYIKEGIVWTIIDFYDNQPCIDLIEAKLGILDLLDEECRVPNGSDESWARKLIDKCAKYKHFEKPRFGDTSFLVRHFSDIVQYAVDGFLEKNRDAVSKELVNIIRQSDMLLCKELMNLEESDVLCSEKAVLGDNIGNIPKQRMSMSKQHKRTVGSQFRESLGLLIATLDSTSPHYVRCIKPNESKTAFKWEAPKIVQQLRACGVLETVRISAAGFPSRLLYHDFFVRYQLLAHSKELTNEDLKASCKRIVLKWIKEDDRYRFGNTQIFFRQGQIAYLEQMRLVIRNNFLIIVQSTIRRFVYRTRYLRLRRTAIGIQTYCRGFSARKKAKELRQTRAAIIIQKYTRGWLCSLRFRKLQFSIKGIQKHARGLLARRRFKVALDNYKATQIQKICRGFLARLDYQRKIRAIILCQASVRRFLARRQYKKLKAEAKTISHIQKMYKGLENKIISLQQRIDELIAENKALKTKNKEIPVLRQHVQQNKKMQVDLNNLNAVLLEKENSLVLATKQLESERDDKMQILDEKSRDSQEWNDQKHTWRIENDELKKRIGEMIEMAKADKQINTNRSRILSDVDNDEIHQAYQRAVKDKELLETENYFLKGELKKHSYGKGNANQNDEDFGYASAKSTLNHRHKEISPFKRSKFERPLEYFNEMDNAGSQITLIVKLRSILEDEKVKNKKLTEQINKLMVRNKPTADSLRLSELEVDNEKLRHDYSVLLKSIKCGMEMEEIEAQHSALQEELRRRRDECIQLRAVLQDQSQSLKILSVSNSSIKLESNAQDRSELLDAFEAQKLVNRQLESELTAITEENNIRLADLTNEIEMLLNDKLKLQDIVHESLSNSNDANIDILRQNERYLKYEIEKTYLDYATMQQQLNEARNKIEQLTNINNHLTAKLHDHGLTDNEVNKAQYDSVVVKKKAQNFQGIFKYRHEDIDKIFQFLITDLTPRVAISLLPALPAYIIFMCIRYTDLVNADQHVKELLTKFVLIIKKYHRVPHPTENRVLWLINTLTLLNLLKQYGGIEEYIKLNSDTQNQQQLKNFDLSEYRQVIYEIITNLYEVLVRQVQGLIKSFVVPAILDHDEMSRGKNQNKPPGRAVSLDLSPEHDHLKTPEPKSLVNQLEHYYKQFQYFGLDFCYTEQIFKQLFYFICAVSMNSLMLRADICVWKTGMKIRYNISCLEDWVRKKKMSNEILAPILPMIQVSALLQSRKNEEDVQSIFELCSSLSAGQVLKIIKSYNPDDCENRISNAFIEKLSAKLNEKQPNVKSSAFTMDEEFVHPLKVLFKHSEIKLEEIELPESLNLHNLLVKI